MKYITKLKNIWKIAITDYCINKQTSLVIYLINISMLWGNISMEFEGPLDPMDPRSSRSLRTAQRVLNEDDSTDISEDSESIEDTEGIDDTAGTEAIGDTKVNDEIREMQNKVLEQLRRMSDAIFQISSTQTNVASLRIEQVSEVYFTRQVRPLLDALYFISISSLNIAGVAQVLQTNTFGERKELRESLKLVYSMNNEIDSILEALSRRIKIYLCQLREMDKKCPPFVNIREDS